MMVTIVVFVTAIIIVAILTKILSANLSQNWVWLGIIGLIAFCALDTHSTWIGISRFGYGAEGNDFPKMLMENFGFVGWAVVKTLTILGLCWWVLLWNDIKAQIICLIPLNLVFAVATLNNYYIFLR